MAPQYDNLGPSYEQMEQSPVRIYAERVSFFRILGSLEGCTVLDVACGTGYYTRQLKRRGAKSVLGVDVSPGMINLAKETEYHQKDGVEYQVYDAVELPHLGSFDVVTAIYLLVYAESKAQLLTMCQNLYRNLASPGRLVTVVANPGPLLPRARSFKYGGTNHRPATVKEGDRYELEPSCGPTHLCFLCSLESGNFRMGVD